MYIHAALLIDKCGEKITEEKVSKLLHLAGAKVDENRVKPLVSALEGVDIKETIRKHTTNPLRFKAESTVYPIPAKEVVEVNTTLTKEKKDDDDYGLGKLFGD